MVLTAFAVVVGTLVIQGLTLKALLRALDLQDDDPVGHELEAARARALHAGLASFQHDRSPVADAVREEFTAHLASTDTNHGGDVRHAAHDDIHRTALQAARQAVIEMRTNDEIGDDAFHQLEEELDWLEMAGGGREPESGE
jgi:CPA1 family monovalent cation:H+ antiporter